MTLWRILVAALLAALACAARAGVMTRESMQQAFPSPISVGEKDAALPVWPLFKQDATATVLVGYAFESIDLAPIPGFSGTPMNLLVLLDPKGGFVEVRVLSQHEPVFLDGLGEGPMHKFVEQYQGLSLKQNIKIGSNITRAGQQGSANVYIDGVAKATASVRILNQSLLSSALKVARAKLGFAHGRDPELVAHIRPDVFERMDWAALERAGLVAHLRLAERDVERAFAGSVGEGQDADALAHPEGTFIDLYVAHLGVPSVGRNLLGDAGWQRLRNRIDEGDHALLVVSRGRYSFVGDDFVRGAVPDRLVLRQGELPLEIRDLDFDAPLALPGTLRGADSKVFRVIGQAGLDPAQALQFALRVTRSKGIVYPERASRDFKVELQVGADYVVVSEGDNKGWRGIWTGRAIELGVLVVALGLLAAALARPRWLSRDARRLAWFRNAYLVFTLVFIGWFAQGQLSIVNVTALVQAIKEGRSLGFFLYDPMTVVLWAFVAVTLVAWGRGAFCGWLCPFGALQDLVSQLAQRLKVPQWKLHRRWDARLKWVKYGVLTMIVATAAVSGPWTDRVVEIEPFKTAITLAFVRSWPFVLWAVGLVALSAVLYKGYCRYLCPLGAGLAILGLVRVADWLPRRAECGTPCQTCRHACAYQAITPEGAIDYDECFQCLECVQIHENPKRCAPLVAQTRGRRIVPIAVAPAGVPVEQGGVAA